MSLFIGSGFFIEAFKDSEPKSKELVYDIVAQFLKKINLQICNIIVNDDMNIDR